MIETAAAYQVAQRCVMSRSSLLSLPSTGRTGGGEARLVQSDLVDVLRRDRHLDADLAGLPEGVALHAEIFLG